MIRHLKSSFTNSEEIKDIFVVGCTVALRYFDLINLKTSNIELENKQYYLKVQSQKAKVYTHTLLSSIIIFSRTMYIINRVFY